MRLDIHIHLNDLERFMSAFTDAANALIATLSASHGLSDAEVSAKIATVVAPITATDADLAQRVTDLETTLTAALNALANAAPAPVPPAA